MEAIVRIILDSTLAKHRSKCPMNITDLVFLEIEKNFRKEYEACILTTGKGEINKKIGRLVRVYWDLKNINYERNPKSELIKSYTKHSN